MSQVLFNLYLSIYDENKSKLNVSIASSTSTAPEIERRSTTYDIAWTQKWN